MTKVAIIDKAPSRNTYKDLFTFDFDLYHLSSVPVQKLLKKNVDLTDFEPSMYDFVILVGAEATKMYAKVSVSAFQGILCEGKYLPMSNPSMFVFKPEGKPEFDRSVAKINKYISGELTNVTVTGDFKGIQDETEALEYLQMVLSLSRRPIALDSETTALYTRNGHILGISISHEVKQGRYIDSSVLTEECVKVLQQILDKHIIVFHNRKFDQHFYEYHLGVTIPVDSADTMVMHYTLDETPGSHGLKVLALKHTNYGAYDAPLEDFKNEYCALHGIKKDEFTYDLIPFEIMYLYAAIDTAVTLELYNKFWPIIEAHPKLSKLYTTLLIPATQFLKEVEDNGIPIDAERMKAANKYLEREITTAKAKIWEFEAVQNFEKASGKIFNPNSVQQLREVLFTYAGLEPVRGKLTATGAISTDAEVLSILSREHDLPKAILVVRKLSKIKNTYVNKILPALDKDSRVRTNFNLIFTTSGRLSSSGKMNAQQIPRDDPIIKGCIKAASGYKIISQDLSTAEVYYASVLSGDKKMQGVFKAGGDFHSSTAKLVFNLPCPVEDVKRLYPTQRQAAKAVTFGILYGSGAASVAETVTKSSGEYFSVQDAQDAIDDYFRTFNVLKKWLDAQKKLIQTQGYVFSFFGRKRRLSNVFSPDKGIAAHEIRSGINALIQSLASDMNLIAAMEINEQIKREGLDAFIFMLVHDSIVIHCREDQTERVMAIMKECTQRDRGCSIPDFPVGVDQDCADDYSFGDFEDTYGHHEIHGLYKLKEGMNSDWVLNEEINPDDENEEEVDKKR